MAYMRGDYYLWRDQSHLHIWARDGYDGWDCAIWACGDDDSEPPRRQEGFEKASGVSLPQEIADEYVVMRLAQMLLEGVAGDAVDRAVRNSGNYGAMALAKNAERLKAALSRTELEPRDES